MSHLQRSTGLRALLGAALLSSALSSQGELTTTGEVVLTIGEAHASLPAGVTIGGTSALDSGVMDLAGNLVFRARLTGTGVVAINERAYFHGRNGGDLRMILRGNDPAPGLAGLTLNSATASGIGGSIRLSSSGLMMFSSTLSGAGVTTTNDSAIFAGPPGAFSVVAREGDLAGGTAGAAGCTYSTSFSISHQPTGLNDSGMVLFQSNLLNGDVSGTTNNSAWFSGFPGILQVVQRKGDVVLGGAVVSALGFVSQMNGLGQVLHDETLSTTLGTTPATASNNVVLFLWTPGSGNAVVVREGDPAPGTAGATFNTSTNSWFVNTGACTLTASGRTAIVTDLLGGDVTTGVNDRAVYFGGPGSLSMVFRRGDVAPGTGGLTFNVVNNTSLTCSDDGTVTFICTLAGPGVTTDNDSSIWTGTAGNLVMVAREGDPAPGVPGFTFAAGGIVGGTGSPLTNERHQFLTGLTVTNGVTSPRVTFGYDPLHGLVPLLIEGDVLNTAVGPSTVTTVGGIQFNSGDSCPLSFNNNGDFTYRVNYAGGGSIVRGHLGSMRSMPSSVSASAGGAHTMNLDAGVANQFLVYVVLVTGSGTRPGFTYTGQQIPLNFDVWTNLGLAALNFAPWSATVGNLDANGRATASFTWPSGYGSFAGTSLHHAFVLLDLYGNATFASEPCGVLLY